MNLKYILIIQLSCLCRASPNSTQTDSAHVQVRAEDEISDSDPRIHRPPGKCHFTFMMSGNRSSDVVAFTADSMDTLVEQICQDLECGSVYHVINSSSPANISCFDDCYYKDGRLKNCSQTFGENCMVISEVVCGHHVARLSGGTDRCAGRVELWRDGSWGTVCDDQWDLRDADVVCAQLGCGYAINVTGQGGLFSQGKGPVHLDELNCTGKEEHLWACPSAQEESDCGHKEDAGVVCSEMRAVRLTGGLDRCSGKVEVHRNGSWGTVCDNCWNKKLASIVCSMLQCGDKPQQFSRFNPPLTHNKGTQWYYQCSSSEQSLWQCREIYNRPFLCTSSKASGVICEGSLGFPNATTASPGYPAVTTPVIKVKPPVSSHSSLLVIGLVCFIAVSLFLFVILVINTTLCCHYRRTNVILLQQTSTKPGSSSEHHYNSYQDSVNLVKVTANTANTDVPSNPRYLWTQLSSVDSTSVDTDYEQYEPNAEPSVPLSTFRNSQRYKTDVNSLVKPAGLESLCEEGPDPENEVMGAFTGCNGGPIDAQYARVSKISVDSFDTSSTSSEEYENTNTGYVLVTTVTELEQTGNDQYLSEQSGHLQSQGDGENEPVYSPVCPDQNPSTDDDYDDIDCLP